MRHAGSARIELQDATAAAAALTAGQPGTVLVDTRDAAPRGLSVIVPMFGTAGYVRACLDSVIAAGSGDIELVIVDDGSPDDCAQVAHDWIARSGAAAVLVARPNGGLSAARNTGLLHARGDYLTFLDSDDLFDGATYRRMLGLGRAHGADLVFARAVCMDSQTQSLSAFPGWAVWWAIMGDRPMRRTTLAREPRLMGLEPSATTRLYRAAFARRIGLAFPEGLTFEDLPAHVRSVARAGCICLLGETGLQYRVGRPGQITATRGSGRQDSLATADMAIGEALAARLGLDAGACAYGGIARLLFWCAQHVARDERPAFLARAAEVLRRSPPGWATGYAFRFAPDETDRMAALAFARADIVLLAEMAEGAAPGLLRLAARAGQPGMRRPFVLRCRAAARGWAGAAWREVRSGRLPWRGRC